MQQIEAVGHVQLVAIGRVLGNHLQRIVGPHFAHRGGVGELVQQRAQPLQERQVLGLGLVVQVALPGVGVDPIRLRNCLASTGLGRVVVQRLTVEVEIDGIQPETVHTQLQPEAHVGQQCILHLAVVEVQVWLTGQEVVQVILHPPRVPAPGTAAKDGLPVIGGRTIRLGIGPHVPVGFRILAALTAFDEPGVFIGSVRQHLVDDHLQTQRMCTVHQRAEIVQCPEDRIDRPVVRDVVTEVVHRALEEGR